MYWYTRVWLVLTILSGVLFLSGCDGLVEYSPYEVRVRVTNVNPDAIGAITLAENDSVPFVFAVISDPHSYYSDLADAVSSINKNSSVLFTVVCGDVTDAGLFKEFDWEHQIISKLKVPFVTVIGNHDCLSNGKLIYDKMYGPTNFSFSYRHTQLVFFDDVVWENNNATPNFTWLSETLNDGGTYTHRILFAHIPPGNDQLQGADDSTFRAVLKDRIDIGFFGHNHDYECKQADGFRYVVVGSVCKRYYTIVTVEKDTIKTEEVEF
ncbi:MAG TPA: metallophosphoesterase [Williamwhitmania sp.]|nr:metallophosphoesterase [Williamwhitmania sp.]